MKRLTLPLALCLAIFGTTSQASNNQASNAAAQPAVATTTTAKEGSVEEEKSETLEQQKQEKLKDSPTVSPQVQKLIGLYPALVSRIQPYGRVCFDGGECDITINVLTAAVDGQPRDGKTIYNAVCKTCHDTGLVGAPKFGDKGAWGARIGKGKDTLYNNAINGIGAMPAKGGADIADEEVKNAVDYIVEQSS